MNVWQTFAVVFLTCIGHLLLVPSRDLLTVILALVCLDGVYLPKQENDFVNQVSDELEQFQREGVEKKVLVFPPMDSRLRYLIHRTTECFKSLTSFSVGEEGNRQTIVCRPDIRLPPPPEECENMSSDRGASRLSDSCGARYHTDKLPGRLGTPITTASASKQITGADRPRKRIKRPDQPLYVPRALRQKLDISETGWVDVAKKETHTISPRKESLHPVVSAIVRATGVISSSLSTTKHSSRAFSEMDLDNEKQHNKNCVGTRKGDMLLAKKNVLDNERKAEDYAGCESPSVSSVLESKEMNEVAAGQAASNIVSMDIEEQGIRSSQKMESEANHNETECSLHLIQEIAANLKEKDAAIVRTQLDYSSYINISIEECEFGHFIEIYDFEPESKTEDLMEYFIQFQNEGFELHWVDETHALGMFPSECSAQEALSMNYPSLKTRPLSAATWQTKLKAKSLAEYLQPSKDRPRMDSRPHMDSAVAKRLLSRALGIETRDKGPRNNMVTIKNQEI